MNFLCHFPKIRTRYGTENLRQYLEEARMPTISRYDRTNPYCLPLVGKRTHKNKLKVRHNADRRLAKIRQYDPVAFDNAVQAYHKKFIYGRKRRPYAGKPYERSPGEALVLSSGKYRSEASFADIPYPSNIEETCRWVVERPLRTMQRAVHVAFPDTTRWWLDDEAAAAVPDADRALWRTYVWRFHPDEHHKIWWRDVPKCGTGAEVEPAPHEAMVVAVQSPWILGPRDLQDVAGCTDMMVYDDDDGGDGNARPECSFKARQRVWGKLYDTCTSVDCHTFVLTNYDGWIFGRFSDDWTAVHTSEVKTFDARAPNVVQALVFWVATSMDLVGTKDVSIPCVEEGDHADEKEVEAMV